MHDVDAASIRALIDRAPVPKMELRIVAQPLVDTARVVIVGYELLSRFTFDGREVPPDRVFAAAAAQGLGVELETFALEHALEAARSRPPNCFISVNVDPRLLDHPATRAVLADRELHGLVFELTEHNAFDDLDAIRTALDGLRVRGAIIALDDAGAGYAGLTQILELKPELIKLDRGLIKDVDANEAKRAMVVMIGDLAAKLDAWVLAEGVETAAETDVLTKIGVPLLQGFFLGRPGPLWAQLDPVGRDFLSSQRFARTAERDDLSPLISPCLVLTGDQAWPTGGRVIVRIDEAGRPIAMRIAGDGCYHDRAGRDLLRIRRDSSVGEVVQRAMTRAERVRWDPLLCVDDLGNFEGIVALERVITSLAESPRRTTRIPVLSRASTGVQQLG